VETQHQPEVVVITGASAGVGRATARAFAKRGAHIGLLARGKERLEAARSEVEAAGGKALVLPTDVADPDQIEHAATAVENEFGPIDIWVNDAMTTIFAPFSQITPQEFKRATEVTYLGQVYGTMAALKRMLPRDRGSIVQVGSALAYRPIPLQSAYCGAKHAIMGFTEAVRSELLHDGSRVNITIVQMPALNTPQFDWCMTRLPRHPRPVAPVFQPEVAAEAIVWAAHHRRRQVYVGLSSVATIWANRFMAGLLDRYLAHSGYRAQQADEPVDPDRPHNLWQPVKGDAGARGRFGQEAYAESVQLWVTKHRGWLALAGAGAALLSTAVMQNRRNSA
jgi:short-subunit dehydrogenase